MDLSLLQIDSRHRILLGRAGRREGAILCFFNLRLQDLPMVLHALDVGLCVLESELLSNSGGVDVAVGEDDGG